MLLGCGFRPRRVYLRASAVFFFWLRPAAAQGTSVVTFFSATGGARPKVELHHSASSFSHSVLNTLYLMVFAVPSEKE